MLSEKKEEVPKNWKMDKQIEVLQSREDELYVKKM
jgi:hypothetical protein